MSSLLHSELVRSLPHSLKIESKIEAGIVSRAFRSFPASGALFSPAGISTMSCILPAIGWLDFNGKSYLHCQNFSWSSTDSNAELSRSAHSLFRRISVYIGGQLVTEIDSYDVIASVLQDITLNSDQQNTIFGMNSLMNSDVRKIKTGISFSLQPLMGILRTEKLIPLHYMGPMEIRFLLNSPDVCFKSTAPVSYQMEGVKYCCDVLTLNEEVENLARQAYNQDKLRYHFQNWRAFPAQSQSQVYDMRVECQNKSVDGLIIVPRDATILTDRTKDSYVRTQGSLYEVQYAIGSNLLDRHDCTRGATQVLYEVEKLLDASNSANLVPTDWSSVYGASATAGSKFLLGLHTATLDDPNAIAGYKGQGAIVVSMKHSAPLTNPIHYTSFCLHDVVLMNGASIGVQVDA